jgi:hypothetical protein
MTHRLLKNDASPPGRDGQARTSVYLGIALLGLMLLLAATHAPYARGESSSMDIAKQAISGNYEVLSPTELILGHDGDSVELQGPMTIYVGTKAGLELQEETVTIGAGKTRTFRLTPPQDLIAIRLLSVGGTEGEQTTSSTQKGSSGLANLFFGLPNAQDVQDFAQQNGSFMSIPASLAQGEAAEARFTKVLSAGGAADYPNVANAATSFKYIQILVGLKDDAGKPLFPSFQNKGIQALLTLMAISAARDAKNTAPLESLGYFLAGMDMKKYKPAAAQ